MELAPLLEAERSLDPIKVCLDELVPNSAAAAAAARGSTLRAVAEANPGGGCSRANGGDAADQEQELDTTIVLSKQRWMLQDGTWRLLGPGERRKARKKGRMKTSAYASANKPCA